MITLNCVPRLKISRNQLWTSWSDPTLTDPGAKFKLCKCWKYVGGHSCDITPLPTISSCNLALLGGVSFTCSRCKDNSPWHFSKLSWISAPSLPERHELNASSWRPLAKVSSAHDTLAEVSEELLATSFLNWGDLKFLNARLRSLFATLESRRLVFLSPSIGITLMSKSSKKSSPCRLAHSRLNSVTENGQSFMSTSTADAPLYACFNHVLLVMLKNCKEPTEVKAKISFTGKRAKTSGRLTVPWSDIPGDERRRRQHLNRLVCFLGVATGESARSSSKS